MPASEIVSVTRQYMHQHTFSIKRAQLLFRQKFCWQCSGLSRASLVRQKRSRHTVFGTASIVDVLVLGTEVLGTAGGEALR